MKAQEFEYVALLMFLFFLIMGGLVACTQYDKLTGVHTTEPETPSMRILEAKALTKAYALTVADLAHHCVAFYDNGACARYAITHAQAMQQLTYLTQVSNALHDANRAISVGDTGKTNQQLKVAEAILVNVLAFLSSQAQQGHL